MDPDLEYNKRPTWNYFTGLPGTGKKSVCAQYGEEFMKMGGDKKRYQFDEDSYILAAVTLYLDIINIFLYILEILAEADK